MKYQGFSCSDLYHLLVASESKLKLPGLEALSPICYSLVLNERDKISSSLTRRSPVEDPHGDPHLDKG
ncbi:hypothetical protein ANANG_G00088970 [Anguilla anguilla]|uniref:Uncharacterized protein n=1 Tax=Anguilla anguilla TaxID=7936 RepID=A0A9D3MNK5_ANGAN|nr:hypothetical protein ANANG_G00088970 [Anguilla anguilla]